VSTEAPSISGTDKDGHVLTATHGTWSGAPAPTYSYQWEWCTGSPCHESGIISGATSSTYTLSAADIGRFIKVIVIASNASYPGGAEAEQVSHWTSVVEAVPPVNAEAPSVSGTDKDGSVLTASPGTWSGAPAPAYSYQWQDCSASGGECTDISGATSQVYTLADLDVGHTVRVGVTASNATYAGGGVASASSMATTVAQAIPPTNSLAPSITPASNLQDGQALTASPGSWSGAPAPSYSYQWQDCNASGQACTSI
jgi:hypothetical protein